MTTFKLTPVKSSNLEAYGYSADANELCLRFKGGATHVYEGVGPDVHDAFVAAESKGSHFHAHIRRKFNSRRIDAPAEPKS